jgi:hypothetical protein
MPYNPRNDRDDRRTPYIYPPWSGWYNPYFMGYPGSSGYSGYQENQDPSASQGYAPQDYQPQPDDSQSGDYLRPDLPPWPSNNPPQPAAAQEPVESVTLVFNDGHPTEQIHNYILTSATLYVFDQHRRAIPIGHIDLAATAKVNSDAGVDFTLPTPSR